MSDAFDNSTDSNDDTLAKQIEQFCKRGGCPLAGSHHTFKACMPDADLTKLKPCNEETCTDPKIHGVGDCRLQFRQCTEPTHRHGGQHFMHQCEGTSQTQPIGFFAGQINPLTGNLNARSEIDPCDTFERCPEHGDHTGPCKERCTNELCRNKEIHLPNSHSCIMGQIPASDIVQNPDHVGETYDPDGEHSHTNKISLGSRIKRIARKANPFPMNVYDFMSGMLLTFAILNGVLALSLVSGMIKVEIDSLDARMLCTVVAVCVMALLYIVSLSISTRMVNWPENGFDAYIDRIIYATALIMSSLATEAAVFYISTQVLAA